MNSQNIKQYHKHGCPFHQQESMIETIGKEYQPFVSPQLQEPYSFYERARKQEPIFYSSLLKGYVVSLYDDIISILKDPVRFSSRETLQGIVEFTPETIEVLRQGFPLVSDLLNSDGERHKLLRAPLQKVFAWARIKNMSNSITAIANRLIDSFINDGKADIITQFAYPLPLEVIFTLYGIPLEMMADFKRWGNDYIKLNFSAQEPEEQLKCAHNFVKMQHTIAKLIEEKRKVPQNDLISDIQDSELTINDMVIVLSGLIAAGYKTTSHLIGNTLKILLEKPAYWQAICEDSSIIPMILQEALRYEGVVPGMIRITNEEVSISGLKLPKNSKLFLMFASGNRDESHYKDAQKFDPQRFQNKTSDHLAFGHGIHRCIGANLALLEVRIAFELLSARLHNLRIAPNQQYQYIPVLITRGFTNLMLEWDIN